MEFFKSEKLSNRLYRITEFSGVCCYLIVGDNKACLLDTCCGYGNIKEYAETLTDKPIFLILTHGHYDHMGGAALFDEVYMNLDDMPVFKNHGDMKLRIKETKAFPQTAHVKEKDIVPTRVEEIKDIKDGDIFDLGGITIKMILVKGHTPGMMCPLIQEEKSIIFGDACGVGVLLFDEYSSNVSEYKNSLLNLKKYEHLYNTVYRNHGTFFSNKDLLDNVIECCDLILEGKDDREPVEIHGYKLFAARKTNNGHSRADGKEGNIMYALEKVK
ncbi:MBL fold metallo-hydrolase [Clostridium intestinale]|uniref:MBL fold metallo-hydrolase n=1 Tax=Clostridium intestinale TaxID=36845 RepID=UPI002DD65995|nr:MBL fold metallo-hydrolase [Clostridium intestinale]WRY51992.1 MBL fold metallo-hydrolase [Clostridium intestinale]